MLLGVEFHPMTPDIVPAPTAATMHSTCCNTSACSKQWPPPSDSTTEPTQDVDGRVW